MMMIYTIRHNYSKKEEVISGKGVYDAFRKNFKFLEYWTVVQAVPFK